LVDASHFRFGFGLALGFLLSFSVLVVFGH